MDKRLSDMVLISCMLIALLCTSNVSAQTINVIGDSYVRNHRRPVEETWHYKAAMRNGCKYNNYGRNGSCIAFDRSKEGFGPSLLVRYADMDTSADVVIIIAGHNDATKIGNSTDSLAMFADSLDLLLARIESHCHNARIGFVTPWFVSRDGFCAVVKTIKSVCKRHGVAVLDNYKRRSVVRVRDEAFRKKYFQGDNDYAHLNAEGHDLFLPYGNKFVVKLLKKSARTKRRNH